MVIVCTLFVVPLALMLPLVSKWLDAKHRTIEAARYAAWERTVYLAADVDANNFDSRRKSDPQIRNEIGVRIFSEGGSVAQKAFLVGDKNAGGFKAGLISYLNDRRAANNPQMGNWQNLGTVAARGANPGQIPNGAVRVVDAGMRAFRLNPICDRRFALDYTGSNAASFSFNMSAARAPIGQVLGAVATPLETRVLNFRDNSAVLSNGWSAASPTRALQMANGLSPLCEVRQLAAPLALLAPQFPELILLQPFSRVDYDILPRDRLR